MKLSTKVSLGIVVLGAMYTGGYEKEYKEAYNLLLIGLIIVLTWLNERKK